MGSLPDPHLSRLPSFPPSFFPSSLPHLEWPTPDTDFDWQLPAIRQPSTSETSPTLTDLIPALANDE